MRSLRFSWSRGRLPRRWLRCLLAATLTGGALPTFAAEPMVGDLDHDSVITVLDLARQIAIAGGQVTLPETESIYADVDRNGFFNDGDSEALVRLILETDTPTALPPATVRETSPSAGSTSVAVTREFVLRFTIPLALDAVITTHNPDSGEHGHLYAEFAGTRRLTRAELSSDRKKATLFFLEPLPSAARVRVIFDPTGLQDLLGRGVDGDGDGIPGGVGMFDFDTLAITPLAGVGVTGTVYGIDTGTTNSGSPQPLAGVTITVDGAEETLRTTTGADGKFLLTPAPAGKFFVLIDGRTANAAGGYFPFVGKAWTGIPGRLDTPATPATAQTAAGDIFLPFIPSGTLNAVSATQDTTVTFAPSVLAANPELAGVEINVPANSLFADTGARGGMVGIAPVAPARLPEPLPRGLNLPLVITIQTDGATNFDRPVPVRFPNTPDPATGAKLPPGAKSALWSFDHDTGKWEIAGPMTVTPDGNFVETDAGVGVRQPGWHGTFPGASGSGGPLGGDNPDNDGDGTPDSEDEDVDGDDLPNGDDDDIDGDGIPNGEDEDTDGDGVDDADDNDDDGDGFDDGVDDDDDNDGEEDEEDGDSECDVTPTVTVNSGVNISANAITVLTNILKDACLTSGTVTSGRRSSADQARIMYENLEAFGVEAQDALYAAPGEAVIDVYETEKAAGKTADEIKAAMQQKIIDLGPSSVSKHCSDTHDTLDVAPSTISDHAKFIEAVNAALTAGTISGFLQPPQDPAFHIEIEL